MTYNLTRPAKHPRWEEKAFNYVRVKDASTGEYHFLSVPNTARTCQSAIAWTFGMKAKDYHPLIET